MKTALLLHGQPRFVEECFNYIKTNLLIPNNCDVFIHMWYDDALVNNPYKFGGSGGWINQRIKQNIDKKIIELYGPVSYSIEAEKSFKNSALNFESSIKKYFKGALERPDREPNFRDRTINNMYSMWYSVAKVNDLKKCHELKNDFKYDYVIHTRTDLELRQPIICSQYDNNALYYIDMGQPDGMVSDWINFGSSEIMDNYSSIFVNIETYLKLLLKERNVFCNELLIRKVCDLFNISYKSYGWHATLPRF